MDLASENNLLKLSTDSETEGFDFQAGKIWIYPTNYPLRDYQYNIIQQALLKNTLVSLPTGLGKTFIAAVVMYNFFRWYPNGKIIFMAPTRPLVKQQIDACYDIMGIPKEVTAEMTGSKVFNSRKDVWDNKRVFFVTPQVLQNDLDNLQDLGKKIRCLVFDEAHKAKGNHAYCEVIRKLNLKNKYFRVLALSATPGGNINDVREVANSLLISRLEFRTEDSSDVQPYVFQRNIETVVVPLGSKLQEVKDSYLSVLEYYTRILVNNKVIHGNCSTLTKGKIFMTMKDYQQKGKGSGNYGEIMKSLNICVTLYHAYELLIRHGLRSFLSFFEEHIDKPLLRGNHNIIRIMENVKQYLGPAPNVEQLPDGTYTEISPLTKFGHPKYHKLQEILIHHFTQATHSTRVIVFFEYRDSVMEAYAILLQAKHLIKPRIFLGQGCGVTQKVQINVIKAFREGTCNTLLSTCIGEEGLDVGDVDLIVCFDVSNASPIRMIQRMGRTGRKKEGKIFILVTEGKEQDTLKNCLIHKQNLAHHVLTSKELNNSFQKESPRMVPLGIVPKCEKMFITVRKPALTKNSTIKDLFKSISSNSSDGKFFEDVEIREFEEKILPSKCIWNESAPILEDVKPEKNIYSRHIEKQRSLQPTCMIRQSRTSQAFVHLLQFADSKRYNIPLTQGGGLTQLSQEKNMKQGDIRNMFFKLQNKASDEKLAEDHLTQSQVTPKQAETDILANEVFDEIRSYLLIQQTLQSICKLCSNGFNCQSIQLPRNPVDLQNWVQPDITIFDSITAEDLDHFAESLSPKSKELHKTLDVDVEDLNLGESFFNVDLSILEESKVNESFSFVPPKNLTNVLNKLSIVRKEEPYIPPVEVLEEKFDLNDLLAFFKLSSVEDLYAAPLLEQNSENTIIYSSNSPILTQRYPSNPEANRIDFTSPVIKNSQKIIETSHSSTSPVLSFKSNKIEAIKVKKNLNKSIEDGNNTVPTPSKFKINNSELSSTPIIKKKVSTDDLIDDIDDFCDLSIFGISRKNTKPEDKPKQLLDLTVQDTINEAFNIEDICDLSAFGLTDTLNDENKSPPLSPVLSLASQANMVKMDSTSDSQKLETHLDITRMISLVSKVSNTKTTKELSQKENIDTINIVEDLDDLDDFNFSFNAKKTPSKNKLSLIKNTQRTPKCPPSVSKISPVQNQIATKSSWISDLDNSIVISSDDDFQPTSKTVVRKKQNKMKKNPLHRNVTTRKKKSDFICMEADISDDDVIVSGDESDGSDQDCYDMSFVADSQEIMHNTQLHANYLQSIRSPVRPGQFKIPDRPKYKISNVFSQFEDRSDDTYMNDSFCVNTEDIDGPCHDLSELEILELKLKRSKRNKRKSKEENAGKSKRRRIIQISDDSD